MNYYLILILIFIVFEKKYKANKNEAVTKIARMWYLIFLSKIKLNIIAAETGSDNQPDLLPDLIDKYKPKPNPNILTSVFIEIFLSKISTIAEATHIKATDKHINPNASGSM